MEQESGEMTRRSQTSVPALDVLLGAVEQAQDELIEYLDPNSPTRSAEATIDKLTHILEDPEVLDAMIMLG